MVSIPLYALTVVILPKYFTFCLKGVLSTYTRSGQLQEARQMNIYQEQGFETRREYLTDLACEMEVDLDTVLMMADLLGKNEDFDGLVTTLEDHAAGY